MPLPATGWQNTPRPKLKPETLNPMKNLCIYHANCNDGFAAALAVWTVFKNQCEYIPASYGDPPPDVTGKSVIIVDFSYPRAELEKMNDKAASLVVIDHHKTAKADLDDLDYAFFDETKSGAVLTWEFLYEDQPLPEMFRYIQDRDLWQWQLPNSKAFSAGLNILPKDFNKWNQVLQSGQAGIEQTTAKGKTILEYQEQCTETAIAAQAGTITLAGHTVPCINTSHLISEIVGTLAEKHPFAVGYFDTKDKRVFSLRSRQAGLDVSDIAKQYGGGGHPNAAGFTIPLPVVLEPACRVCGCTEDDCSGCIERTGMPCYWVEEDLCSACQESESKA